jgi:hypothetical protein
MSPGPRRDLLLLHVPKTAGTSLRHALQRRPDGRRVLLDYGPAAIETSAAIRALIGPPSRYGDLRRSLPPAPGGLLLAGHFSWRRYWGQFNADSAIAFLRDPVARVVATWNHRVRWGGLAQGLAAFALAPRNRDVMARLLGPHWRHFGFIGLAEHYAACLPLLAAHCGTPIAEERLNIGTYPADMPGGRVDAATAAAIAAANPRDLALYAAVAARWQAQGAWVPDPPAAAPVLRAWRSGGAWVGWCGDAASQRTWQVAVRVAGAEVARVWADRPPRGEARRSRTGIGGFVVPVGDGASGNPRPRLVAIGPAGPCPPGAVATAPQPA